MAVPAALLEQNRGQHRSSSILKGQPNVARQIPQPLTKRAPAFSTSSVDPASALPRPCSRLITSGLIGRMLDEMIEASVPKETRGPSRTPTREPCGRAIATGRCERGRERRQTSFTRLSAVPIRRGSLLVSNHFSALNWQPGEQRECGRTR